MCVSGGVGVVSYPVISLGGCVQGVGKDITWYLSVVLNAKKYCFCVLSHLLGANIENYVTNSMLSFCCSLNRKKWQSG